MDEDTIKEVEIDLNKSLEKLKSLDVKKILVMLVLVLIIGLVLGFYIGYKHGIDYSNAYYLKYIKDTCFCMVK